VGMVELYRYGFMSSIRRQLYIKHLKISVLTKSKRPTLSNALICFERRCTKYSSTPRSLYDLTSSSTIWSALPESKCQNESADRPCISTRATQMREDLRGVDIFNVVHVKHYRMRVVPFRRFRRMNEVRAVKFQLHNT
jgi:hypothetical protein